MDANLTFYILKNNERIEKIFRRSQVNVQRLALIFKVREVFFKIYQNKYFCHVNENILFWKKSSQMTEICKFPKDISCHDIDDLVRKMEEHFTKYFW